MDNLVWEIYAVDRKDWTHYTLVGKCFNKGLAKIWVEAWITCDNGMIRSTLTKETLIYDQQKKEWK